LNIFSKSKSNDGTRHTAGQCRLVLGSTFLGLDDVGHFLALSLGGGVAAESLLAEFQGSLVLGDPQQLDASSLVGGKAGNFSDDIVDECGLLGDLALISALSALVAVNFGDLVALVRADDHLMCGCHGVSVSST